MSEFQKIHSQTYFLLLAQQVKENHLTLDILPCNLYHLINILGIYFGDGGTCDPKPDTLTTVVRVEYWADGKLQAAIEQKQNLPKEARVDAKLAKVLLLFGDSPCSIESRLTPFTEEDIQNSAKPYLEYVGVEGFCQQIEVKVVVSVK